MRPNDDLNDFAHLPTVDEGKLAKQELWKRAREAIEAREQARQPLPAEPEPPSPAPKRKLKLRVPPGARAQPAQPEPESLEPALPETEPPAAETPLSQEPAAEPPTAVALPAVMEVAALAKESDEEASNSPPPHKAPQRETLRRRLASTPANPTPEPEPTPPQATESTAAASLVSAQESKSQDSPPSPSAADTPSAPATESEDEPELAATRWQRLWEKIGGRSLTLSVLIHLSLFLIAGFIYLNYTESQRIDFLPGGGTLQGDQASQALENQVTRKKTRWLNQKLPMQRIAVEKSMSDITLPEAKPELLDLPMAKDFLNAGKMGSFGFGSAGAGGGFGSGIGVGGKSGITFTPLSMFGKKIAGRRIAVVLDVSRSMTPFLEDVVKELDRVAAGSPVILYYGCGLLRPGDEKIDETVQRTQAKDFERFWRIWQGNAMLGFSGVDLKKVTFPPKEKIPLEDLYRFFARRNNTYYLDYNGMDFAWTALLCQEIRNADALYWFSDFEDNVDERQLKTVLDNLLVRRQRLYIHPQIHGASFEQVKRVIVEPSGGDVVEPDDGKKKAKR